MRARCAHGSGNTPIAPAFSGVPNRRGPNQRWRHPLPSWEQIVWREGRGGQKQARVGNGQKKMPGALTLPQDSGVQSVGAQCPNCAVPPLQPPALSPPCAKHGPGSVQVRKHRVAVFARPPRPPAPPRPTSPTPPTRPTRPAPPARPALPARPAPPTPPARPPHPANPPRPPRPARPPHPQFTAPAACTNGFGCSGELRFAAFGAPGRSWLPWVGGMVPASKGAHIANAKVASLRDLHLDLGCERVSGLHGMAPEQAGLPRGRQ